MRMSSKTQVEVEFKMNDREAALLHLLTSFDLAIWFHQKCSHQFEAKEIKETLDRLHSLTAKVVEAKKAADEVVFKLCAK